MHVRYTDCVGLYVGYTNTGQTVQFQFLCVQRISISLIHFALVRIYWISFLLLLIEFLNTENGVERIDHYYYGPVSRRAMYLRFASE